MKEKTIEDVRLHCLENGYTKEAMNQICAYLCGKGIKGRKEIIKFLVGDGTYGDFLEWFENDEVAIEAASDLDPILCKIEALEEANPCDEDIEGVVEKLRNLCTWLDVLETDKENKQRIVSILEDLAMYMNDNEE